MTPPVPTRSIAQHDAILEELRRRVGTTFTLAELAAAYAGSERWVREVVEERAPSRGWAPHASAWRATPRSTRTAAAQDYTP